MNTDGTTKRPKRHSYTREEYKKAFDEAFKESPGTVAIAFGILLALFATVGGFSKEDFED